MDDREVRLRCIEAAARTPIVHADGYATGALEAAQRYFDWICPKNDADFGQNVKAGAWVPAPTNETTLRLPKKNK